MSKAPNLADPPEVYDQRYMEQLLASLRLYFNTIDNPDILKTGKLSFTGKDGTLVIPTQADFDDLRYGDVYLDTNDQNRLKVRGPEAAGVSTLSGIGSLTAPATIRAAGRATLSGTGTLGATGT